MPTRTINLKLALSSAEDPDKLKQALWTTHVEMNRAVREIEKLLLLCRGASYQCEMLKDDGEIEEIIVSESDVATEALAMARAAQARNGKAGTGSDEEVLSALRRLYEAMVPSCKTDESGKPLDGDAQQLGTSYAGPLIDPSSSSESGPFADLASKAVTDLPSWVTFINREQFSRDDSSCGRYKDSYFRVNLINANKWIKNEGAKLYESSSSGRRDRWKKLFDEHNKSWAVACIEKQLSLRDDPRLDIRKKCWEKLGLLPLATPHFTYPLGMLWNRLAVRLAVAHLLSWESWNYRIKAEREKIKTVQEKILNEYAVFERLFQELRNGYEADRIKRLKMTSLANDDTRFCIKSRMIRGWRTLREHWLKTGHSSQQRKQILARLQTEMRGGFGDPDLFNWLADEGREHLWRDSDPLPAFVKLNTLELQLEKRKEHALMTFADARLHPRWCMFEAPGGSNLRNYTLKPSGTALVLELPLLARDNTGNLVETSFSVALAPTGQMTDLTINSENSEMFLTYTSNHQEFSGKPGGAEILYDRSLLERRSNEELAHGAKVPVWFKLTLDVECQAPAEWLDNSGKPRPPAAVYHFTTGLAKKSKYQQNLEPGLRVLSVDLGLRTFASCSVFELVKGKPEPELVNGRLRERLCFPTADGRREDDPEKLWALHERSFRLVLPGEVVSKRIEDARDRAWKEIASLKSDIRALKSILRMGEIVEVNDRKMYLENLTESLRARSAFDQAMAIGEVDLAGLAVQLTKGREGWKIACEQLHDRLEAAVSERIRKWRRETSPRPESWDDHRQRRAYAPGKSFWSLEYLEAVRKILLSWGLRGRRYGQVNRLNKKAFGTYASRLLRHINNLKDDRVKTGADLIVQAARGYVPKMENGKQNGWHQRYAPCRVILFEDLARYRFSADRSRRENSKLMGWCHREILKETGMQAEIYGMTVETTGAGFSSRFHAASGAPGVRCRTLEQSDFDVNGQPTPYVLMNIGKLVNDVTRLRPGTLVPWEGGELFATVNRERQPVVVHADMNAAQNLQRRFWSRNGDAYRIKVTGDNDRWHVDASGSRLPGALALTLGLEPTRPPFFSLEGTIEGATLIPLKEKSRTPNSPEDGETFDPDMDPVMAEIEAEEEPKDRAIFFRDPSGIVLDNSKWFGSQVFWGRVRRTVADALLSDSAARMNMQEEMPDDIPY